MDSSEAVVLYLLSTSYLLEAESPVLGQSGEFPHSVPSPLCTHTLPQLGGPPAYSTPDLTTPTSLPVAMGQTLYTIMQHYVCISTIPFTAHIIDINRHACIIHILALYVHICVYVAILY